MMEVIGVEAEGDPWKTPRRNWSVTEMKGDPWSALGNGGFDEDEVENWYYDMEGG